MRTFLIRGAMITFFAVTGLFGSAATVQLDGMTADVSSNTASAEYVGGCVFKWGQKVNPDCEPTPLSIDILP